MEQNGDKETLFHGGLVLFSLVEADQEMLREYFFLLLWESVTGFLIVIIQSLTEFELSIYIYIATS